MSTIAEALVKGIRFLTERQTDEPEASAEMLLASVLGRSRTEIIAFSQASLAEEDLTQFHTYLLQRAKGIPVSHILGRADFCGLSLKVTQDVLTPRPETEELVLFASDFFTKDQSFQILDLCTGSGCIALALADLFSNARVTAVDISDQALAVARENAQTLGLNRVEFIKSDLFENVSGAYDLIISNPPYIPTGDLEGLSKEVKQEPRLALDGGVDGLDLVRRIIPALNRYANPGALVALELGINEAQTVQNLFDSRHWKTAVKKDIVHIERFVFAHRIS